MINYEQPLLVRPDVFGDKLGPDFNEQHFALAVTKRVSHLFNIRKNSSAVMPGLGLRETMSRLQEAQEMGRRVALREIEAQVCRFDTRVEKANVKVLPGSIDPNHTESLAISLLLRSSPMQLFVQIKTPLSVPVNFSIINSGLV
jgi:predicted component of type VI protein secretion system